MTTKTPPYAAYTRPKCAGCSVGRDAVEEQEQPPERAEQRAAAIAEPQPDEVAAADLAQTADEEEDERPRDRAGGKTGVGHA